METLELTMAEELTLLAQGVTWEEFVGELEDEEAAAAWAATARNAE